MQKLIVSGMPRSGTSWTAKTLSFAPGFSYCREPDNADHVAGALSRYNWVYVPGRDFAPAQWATHMKRALTGRIATNFTMKEDPGPLVSRLPPRYRYFSDRFPLLFLRKRNILVKLVRANLALPWIEETFPEAKVVSLIRHPVGQFSSFQRLGWQPRPEVLLSNLRLLEDHLSGFETHIRQAETFWERAGAMWGAVNLVICRQQAAGARHHIVPFEWLCRESEANFETLFARIGLPFPKAARHFLATSNKGGKKETIYSLSRRTRAQIDKWRSEVSTEDIVACRAFAEPFGIPYYDDFNPWFAEPTWGEASY
ncbi:sulfotransferase [Halochromatium glycolicum]|uniref:Sulfotransferase domain-containing protein n=1 Tax=Halochromatium glycolicum TaxID=85075 RepID=A0AAJ0XCG3_9GAMM|nr:sulfotransferase [Halochromatium glycolicum]MBK1707165.1 hypothetical protein [Halochromatium glycolicum]